MYIGFCLHHASSLSPLAFFSIQSPKDTTQRKKTVQAALTAESWLACLQLMQLRRPILQQLLLTLPHAHKGWGKAERANDATVAPYGIEKIGMGYQFFSVQPFGTLRARLSNFR